MHNKRLNAKGFTLVELLVALTITVAIGGAVAALLPKAFAIVGESQSRVNYAMEAQALDTMLERDFASLVPQLGFDGDRNYCAFWTIRQTSVDDFALCHVTYETTKDGVLLTTLSPNEYLAQAETNSFPVIPKPIPRWALPQVNRTLFQTPVAPYAFGGTNTQEQVAIEPWSNATNAPARIATILSVRKGEKLSRLYLRRTRP